MGTVTACFARVAKTLTEQERAEILTPLRNEFMAELNGERPAGLDARGHALQILDRMLGAEAPRSAAGEKITENAATAPVAESLAPGRSADGDAGVATSQGGGSAVHQDPGEKPEAATAGVVKEAIAKAADRKDMTPAQIKAEALRLIDEAIAKAPSVEDGDRAVHPDNLEDNERARRYREIMKEGLAKTNDEAHKVLMDRFVQATPRTTIAVPGDGKFTVVNTKERLRAFRALVEKSPGFSGKTAKPRIEKAVSSGNLSPNGLAREMLDDGEPLNAMQVLDAAGKPMAFGSVAEGTPIPYTDVQDETINGDAGFFSGHSWSSKKGADAWAVIDKTSGLSAGSGVSRAAAVSVAQSNLKQAKNLERLAKARESEAKPQEDLRAAFEKWAENQQQATMDAADRRIAADAAFKAKERERDAFYQSIMGADAERPQRSPTSNGWHPEDARALLNAAEKAGKAGEAADFLRDVLTQGELDGWGTKLIADREKDATRGELTVGYSTVKTGKPPHLQTWDELETSINAQVYVTRNARGEKNYRQWQEAHFEAIKEALARGWKVPDKVLYEYPKLIRDGLSDDDSDLAADAMVTTYQQTKDYAKAVQAYREWSPDVNLKGFTQTKDRGNFRLEDGDVTVLVNRTKTWDGKDRYQARLKNSTTASGPNLTEQQAVDWAANLRDDMRKAEPAADLSDLIQAYKEAKAQERALADAKNVDLNALARAVDATRAARAPLVAKLKEQPALSAKNGNGLLRIVAGSAQKPGQWQLTRFDQNAEPWGDSQYTSQEAAIDDFLREVDIDTLEFGGGTPAEPAAAPAESTAEIKRRGEFQDRMRAYWDGTGTPAIRAYLRAFDAVGAERLERNRIKPAGMSEREWLESYVARQSTWDGGRKTGTTGIQALSQKDLWPTEDGSGERLRKAMLEAVKALKNAPGANSEVLAEAFMEKREAAAPAEAPAEAPKDTKPGAVDNFGEALPPARRNMAAKLTEDLADEDIAKRPFSEIWPLAENEAIEDTFAAAVAHAARAEVPAKPRQPYKLRQYVEKVKTLRGLAGRIVSGEVTRERMATLIDRQFPTLRDWWTKVQLLETLSRDQWRRVEAVEERPDAVTYEDGKQVPAPMVRVRIDDRSHWLTGDAGVEGDARGSVAGNRAGIMALLGAAEPEQRMKFEIRQNTRTGEVFINKEGDAEKRRLMTFSTVEEARAAIKDQYDALVGAWEAVKARDNITERDLRGADNRPRVGKDHRDGKDVTVEQFQERFGFKGGEFGKWVKQGKGDKERQALLNGTYDALMDLSELLNLPPRAMSLNGTLGIALGSRGSGWASAHFEPSNLVINLTKTRGAGTLAHEWFHALDNYFSRLRRDGEEAKFTGDQKKYRDENYITHRPEALMVRKDRARGFQALTQSELEARRERHKNARTGWPSPDAYDADKWERDPSTPGLVRPEVEARFASLVDELKGSPMAKRAALLDKGGGYWSRTLELAARAFESYVIAKMHEQGYHNDFLVNVKKSDEMGVKDAARYPSLLAGEVKPIADAFDALFSEVKTREDDAGNVAMFRIDATDLPPDTAQAYAAPSDADRAAVNRLQLRVARYLPGIRLDAVAAAGRPDAGQPLQGADRARVAAAELLRALTGKRTAFFTSSMPFVNGLHSSTDPNVLFVNANASRPHMAVLGHEFLHGLRADRPDLYEALRDRIRTLAPGRAEHGQTLQQRRQRFGMEALAADKLEEEFLADVMGDSWMDAGFWRDLAGKEPAGPLRKAFAAAFRFISTVLGKLADMNPFGTDVYLSDIRAARKAMAKALRDYVEVESVGAPEVNDESFSTDQRAHSVSYIASGDAYGTPQVIGTNMPLDKVEEAVGKEVAQKIAAGEGRPITETSRSLSGVDLKVGGEGMKAFYDRIVPSALKDVLRKVGGGAPTTVAIGAQREISTSVDDGAGGVLKRREKTGTMLQQPGFDITPKMREAAAGGMPMFSMAPPTESDAFKRWFGDSKVVDAQGKPLVVYHGTRGDFSAFDPKRINERFPNSAGFYATSRAERASVYADGATNAAAGWNPESRFSTEVEPGANVMPVYMAIRNPKIVEGDFITAEQVLDADNGALVRQARADGHDGVLAVRRRKDGYDEITAVAFRPEQIKSAIGNRGTFDPNEADIRLSRALTRRDVLLGTAAAALAGDAGAKTTLGKAQPIPASVMRAALPADVQKILIGGGVGTTNISGAKAVKEALERIAETGPQELRALAKRTAALMPEGRLMLTVVGGRWNAHGAVSWGGPEGPHLRLMNGAGMEGLTYGTFIHESMHAAVLARYIHLNTAVVRDNDAKLGGAPAASKQLDQFRQVWQEFKEASRGQRVADAELQLAIDEARSDPDEFFVRALTDPLLQAHMATMEYRGKTLWDRFKDWVKTTLFGLGPSEGVTPSWLDAALTASQDLLEAMPRDAPDYARLGKYRSLRDGATAKYSLAVDTLQSNETARRLSERAMDVIRSDSTIGVLGRTVGTPYHLAHAKRADGSLRNPDLRRVYDEAQDYLNDINTFANDPAELAPGVVPMLNKWSDVARPLRLAGEQRAKLARALFEGTLGWTRDDQGNPVQTEDTHQGIEWTATELKQRFGFNDEDVGRYQQTRAAIGRSLDFMAAAEVARQMGGRDLPEGLRAMVSRGDTGRFRGLVTNFLTQQVDGAQFALRMLKTEHREQLASITGPEADAKRAALKVKQAIALEVAQERLDKWQGLQRGVQKVYDRVTDLKDRGYMPLMRFGPHTVTVRDIDTKEVLFFGMYETQAEANVEARRLRESAEPNEAVSRGEMSQEQWRLFKGMSPETIELFGQVAGVERTPIFEEYIRRTKANHSALKRLIQRKGTPGFSEDVQRVLAAFLTSNARAAAANLHAGAMEEATQDIDQERGLVKDYATKLTQYVQNPTDESQAIRGLLFVQFIGGSIASAMVNMTQPFTMTLPYLSQHGGPVAAARLLTAGMRSALGRIDPKSDLGKAMARAEKDGIVSPQALHELQGQAVNRFGRTESLLRSLGVSTKAAEAIDSNLRKVLFGWGGFFSLAEQFNRRATFIAAYRLAQEQKQGDPFEFASEAVSATQGVYNRGNRPQFARGPVGGVVMTFKQFSIAYIEFLARLPRREKAIALGVLMVASGLEGLPFADDLDDLIDTIAQRLFGKAFSAKRAKVEFLADTLGLGRDGAEWVLRGATALPGFPVDLAGRMSLGNMLPGTGLLRTDGAKDKSSEVLEALGPAGGVVRDALRGEMLPVAMRNAAKAAEMGRTGEYRDELGRKVADVDGVDTAAKALGFQPRQIARESRNSRMAQSVVAQTRAAESEIVRLWAQGIVDSEPDKIAEARARMADWNERNPDARIAVNRMQIARMARDMRASRDERLVRAAPKELRGRVAAELDQ